MKEKPSVTPIMSAMLSPMGASSSAYNMPELESHEQEKSEFCWAQSPQMSTTITIPLPTPTGFTYFTYGYTFNN